MKRAKILFLCGIVVAVGIVIGYLLTRVANSSPRLTIESKYVNVGTVRVPSEIPFVYFSLSNDGDAPLELLVLSYEGFYDVALFKPRLMPGERVILRALFDVPDATSRLQGTISLSSNDPRAPITTLSATGSIGRYLRTTPDSIKFGEIYESSLPRHRTVSLDPGGLAAPNLLSEMRLINSASYLDLALTDLSDNSAELRIQLLPNAPLGLLRTLVTIRNSDESILLAEIPITATVTGSYSATPTAFLFLGAAPNREESRTATIRGMNPGQHIVIVDDQLALPGCYSVQIDDASSITVTFDGSVSCLVTMRDYVVPIEVREDDDSVACKIHIPIRAIPGAEYAHLRH